MAAAALPEGPETGHGLRAAAELARVPELAAAEAHAQLGLLQADEFGPALFAGNQLIHPSQVAACTLRQKGGM